MATHTLGFSWNRTGESISQTVSITADGSKEADVTVPASTSNQSVAISFVKNNLKSIFISSNYALTLETNDSGTPDDTITLVANTPYFWYYGSGIANPFAGDVTEMFATNGTSSSATLYIKVLEDI